MIDLAYILLSYMYRRFNYKYNYKVGMTFRLCVLASGSAGNSLFIESGAIRLLVDAGISCKVLTSRLAVLGVDIASINGILVTHEHADHVSAVRVIQKKHNIPLYANSPTIEGVERLKDMEGLKWQVFSTGAEFNIGTVKVKTFSVPHDCYDPVGFVLSSEGISVAIVTDIGMPTSLVRECLKGCRAIVLEMNHDEGMLRDADRHWSLKKRILGRQGHLDNAKAAELLAEVAGPELKWIIPAHLSSDCNTAAMVSASLAKVLSRVGRQDIQVVMTSQTAPSAVIEL